MNLLYFKTESRLYVWDKCDPSSFCGRVQRQKDRFSIEYEDRFFVLKPGQSFCHSHGLFEVLSIQEGSWLELEETFVLERKENWPCAVSARHFEIRHQADQWEIEDLNSTNGTYVNGKRIEKTLLHEGDTLFAGGVFFVFFKKGLLCHRPLFDPCTVSEPLAALSPSSLCFKDWKWESQILELEAPAISPKPAKPHWFSSVGSAGMILVSSSVSALAMYLRNPGDISSAATMSLTAVSMACAFLGFGLINRRITSKAQKQKQQEEIRLYRNYLASRKETAQYLRQNLHRQFCTQKTLLETLDERLFGCQMHENWMLPVSCSKKGAASFQKPHCSYHQKAKPLMEEMEALAHTEEWGFSWQMLCQNRIHTFFKISRLQQEQLFAAWCWSVYRPGRKWVWITRKKPSCTRHPASFYKGQLLWFESRKDFEDFLQKNPCMEMTIAAQEDLLEELPLPCENATWIVLNARKEWENAVSFKDCIFENKPADPIKLRQSAQRDYLHDEAQGWDPLLFKKEIQARDFRKETACTRIQLAKGLWWDLCKDGPHALIAGTTGSGKSEAMTSLLLQLALYNDPRHMQFLLIDFKGGSFLNALKGLPHVCGTVTNLEQRAMARLQKALEAELERRQFKIGAWLEAHPFEEGNLESYNRHHPEDPISHLVIVADEFAQLKARNPQAMKFLQETARIGRSLGIHLILATQKPAGIVDDQIWSNAKTRICFQVAAPADSREMLGHEKACHLKEPGSFILQKSDSRQDLQGRALYAKAFCENQSFVQELDETRKPLWSAPLPVTIQETISRLVSQSTGPVQTVLAEDLLEADYSKAPFYRDDIDSLHGLDWQSYSSILFWSEGAALEKTAQVLAAASTKSVVSGLKKTEGADAFLDGGSLWQLESLETPALLLLFADRSLHPESIERLMKNPNLSVVLLCETIEPSWHAFYQKFQLRLFAGMRDREMRYALFTKTDLPMVQWPLFWGQDKNREAMYGLASRPQTPLTREPLPLRPLSNPITLSSVLSLKDPCLLGFEKDGRPLCWDRKQPLIIAYTQSSCQQAVERLLQAWQWEDPMLEVGSFAASSKVALLRLPQDAHLLSTPQGLQQLYDSQICWIGKGLQDYQYSLKLRASGETDLGGVLFTDRGNVSFCPAEILI